VALQSQAVARRQRLAFIPLQQGILILPCAADTTFEPGLFSVAGVCTNANSDAQTRGELGRFTYQRLGHVNDNA